MYMRRLPNLLLSILCVLAFPSNSQPIEKTSHQFNKKICEPLKKVLRKISINRSNSHFDPLYVETTDGDGRESYFQKIDFDRDGKFDKVKRDCGSAADGTCTLYVDTTSGRQYEITEKFFKVIQFQAQYYLLVGDTYPKKNTRRRLYLLTEQGANLVCKSF